MTGGGTGLYEHPDSWQCSSHTRGQSEFGDLRQVPWCTFVGQHHMKSWVAAQELRSSYNIQGTLVRRYVHIMYAHILILLIIVVIIIFLIITITLVIAIIVITTVLTCNIMYIYIYTAL